LGFYVFVELSVVTLPIDGFKIVETGLPNASANSCFRENQERFGRVGENPDYFIAC